MATTKKVSDLMIGERGYYQGDYVELQAGGLSGGCPTDLFLALADESEIDDEIAVPELILDTDDVTA